MDWGAFSTPWHFTLLICTLHFSQARNETCSPKDRMSLPPPVKYSTEVLDSSKNIGSSLGTISPHKKGFGNPHLPHVLRGWEGGLKWGRNIATTLPAHLQKISLSFKSISSHRVVIDIFLRLLHVLLEAITSSCIYLSSTANRLLSAFPRNTHPGYLLYVMDGVVQ